MAEIFVVGHKNPDSDSICSAYSYAHLKNILDPSNRYIPVRCGNLNKQTRYLFERFGVTPPEFVRDVYPRVGDVMTRKVFALDENAPVAGVIRNIDEMKVRITPVVAGGNQFRGVVSIFELSAFFMTEDIESRPKYYLRAENFEKTIKGYIYRRGDRDEFQANVMIGAMPYERFKQRMASVKPEETVLIVGKRRDIIEYAVQNQLPAIVLTGILDESDIDIDFTGYKGWVYVSELDTAETMRRLHLSMPTKSVMNSSIATVSETEYLDAVKDLLLSLDHKGLPVVEDDGRLVGIMTRSDIIKDARRKLVLMDHNELTQAVDGAETAEIVEIVDHHRLGTPRTKTPIHVFAKPVGSTCTLVYQQYLINGVEIPMEVARILLSGILSDTVILKSPTTTIEDRTAVKALSEMTSIDYEQFGVELFSATDSLKTLDPASIVGGDFKLYDEFGIKVGVAQVETVTLAEMPEVQKALTDALHTQKTSNGLDWAMLLVTDIIQETSVLLTTGFAPAEKLLAYKKNQDDTFALPGVLSRKKQLLPEILRVLEELNG